MTKEIIAIPINTNGQEIASAKLSYQKDEWLSSAAEIDIAPGQIIGTAKDPIKLNFGSSSATIISINFSFNDILDNNEKKNNQSITVKTFGISNKNQTATIT